MYPPWRDHPDGDPLWGPNLISFSFNVPLEKSFLILKTYWVYRFFGLHFFFFVTDGWWMVVVDGGGGWWWMVVDGGGAISAGHDGHDFFPLPSAPAMMATMMATIAINDGNHCHH